MQAIIPAAGLGTRLLPFSAVVAKDLAPIGTRPVIHWTLAEAAAVGIESAVVIIRPDMPALQRYLEGDIDKAYFGLDAVDEWMELRERLSISIVTQPKPKGIGDALLRGWHSTDQDNRYYLMYPNDVVLTPVAVYKSMVKTFIRNGLTVIAAKPDRPYDTGNRFLYLGQDLGPVHRVQRVTDTRDAAPKESDKVCRAGGRVIVADEYFEVLEEIMEEGVNGELEDFHAYRALSGRGRLLVAPPESVFHDVTAPEGYKDAWLAYITGELEYAR